MSYSGQLKTAEQKERKSAQYNSPESARHSTPSDQSSDILRLQRIAGNWAVGRLIQARLTVSQPGDPFEREADLVAKHVIHLPQSQIQAQKNSPQQESIQTRPPQITPLVQRQVEEEVAENESEVEVFQSQEISGDVEEEQTVIAAKEQHGKTPMVSVGLEDRLAASSSSGFPLSPDMRAFFEPRFGIDFSNVRIHTDDGAAQMNRQVNALAFTRGQHIYFGTGQYAPYSPSGRQLLAHELTHTIQQTTSLSPKPVIQRQKGNKKTEEGSFVFKIPATAKMDENEFGIIVLMTVFGLNRTEAKSLVEKRVWVWEDPNFKGPTPADITKGFKEVGIPASDYFKLADRSAGASAKDRDKSGRRKGAAEREAQFHALSKKERASINREADRVFWERTHYKPGQKLGGSQQDRAQAELWKDIRDKILADKEKLEALPEDIKILLGDEKSFQPKDYERFAKIAEKLQKMTPKDLQLFRMLLGRDIIRPAKAGEEPEIEDPAEIVRLYQVLQSKVQELQVGERGAESWLRFSRFLDANKDKIEGILHASPEGKLTQEKIEKIIAEYGNYISAEPVEPEEKKSDQPEKLETLEDFEKQFKYDPGWQKLSKEDRKLLLDYAKLAPDQITDEKVNFTRVTTSMKLAMALKLSKSWPGEVAEAAKNAFTDPAFVITLVLTIGIYVGLWLTPDPSLITKIAAGTLTAVMWTQFAWEDIYGFAKAWAELNEQCDQATTVAQLQAAGDKFAQKVGQVGFDILMFIALWGLGKAAGPKLSKIGAERGVARAEAAVKTAEAKPGSGVPKQAAGEATRVIDTARSSAGGASASPGAVLDALVKSLPEGSRKGLSDFRSRLGDARALEALESRLRGGQDIGHFLEEFGMSKAERAPVRKELLEARGKLARAKLIEIETMKDPALRNAARAEWLKSVKAELQKLNIFEDAQVRKAFENRNLSDLIGELGEAIARTLLRGEYPSSKGYTVLSNLELVREVKGFRSIAEWQAAERAKGPDGNPNDIGGLYEKNNKLWKSITEVDGMVVERGASGRSRPVELEQVKTGQRDAPAAAEAQNQKALNALKDIASGNPDIKIFERPGKNTLGKEITGNFDLSGTDSIKTTTRGLPEKGFKKDIPYSREVLQHVAESLLKDGLPPAGPQTIPPLTSPAPKEEEEKREVLVP